MRATTLNTIRDEALRAATVRVRAFWVALAAVGLLIAGQAPVQAQQYATAVGANARGTVRTTARYSLPEILAFREAQPATATWQGERFTEYVIKYTVAANVLWTLEVGQLPAGVTVLAEDGAWYATDARGVTVAQGARGNATEALVRVRVADGGAITWAQDLQLELKRRN